MQQLHFLQDLLVLLGLGVVVVVLFSRVRIPPIVGFLITGVLCGPYGFGLIGELETVNALAEVGVVLLLFTIGIEFSVQQLVRLRIFLLGGGGLQVGLSILLTLVLARVAGHGVNVGVMLGMLVALSSTAIVIRLLADRGEVDAPHGHAALGILIFQDLCIVPMVLAVPFLGGSNISGGQAIGIVVRALLFVALAFAAARWVVPRLLDLVADTRKRDVFLLTILLLCLGSAWASAQAGLSPALGAFIAGLAISDSQYNHQALGEVLPLREVFNSVFFVSIGMLFDVRSALGAPVATLVAITLVLVGKTAVATLAAWVLGQPLRVALLAGTAIAQIGEFSFVLAGAGREAGLLTPSLYQLFLAAAVGTMALTPVLLWAGLRLATAAERLVPAHLAAGRRGRELSSARHDQLTDHVIIVGYGLNGRNLARVLGRTGVPFVVLEMSPEAVRAERRRGRPIHYGDATRREVLEHAGIDAARILVIAISDPAATRAAVALARQLNPRVHILVRSRYVQEMEQLLALGTDEVVPEEFETSIEIFSRVLRRYLVPRDEIEQQVRAIRSEGYEMLRSMSDDPVAPGALPRIIPDLALEAYRVGEGSTLDGTTLARSGLREAHGVTAAAIQREDGSTVVTPTGGEQLAAGDIVLLLGRPDGLHAARTEFAALGR
jgi:monovalent cation:H+ antiporter-2, CPA2 family